LTVLALFSGGSIDKNDHPCRMSHEDNPDSIVTDWRKKSNQEKLQIKNKKSQTRFNIKVNVQEAWL
jgi:hypothetical protein